MDSISSESKEFRKSLNVVDSTAIVVGSMIGSGIFIVSADIARVLGSPGWLMVVWILTAVMTVIAALSYGELASMMPKAGGQYVYLRKAYNPLTGFLYGWTLFIVIQTGTIAAVGMAFAKFMGILLPWFSENHILADLGFIRFNAAQLLAIASIVFLTMINSRGIKLGKIVQNSFTVTKVAAFAGFLIIGFIAVAPSWIRETNHGYFWNAQGLEGNPLTGMALIVAIGTAMVGSLFASDAWNNITFASGEVINPKKTIPRSLLFGTLSVGVLYLLANMVYMNALPLRGLENGSTIYERGMQFATNDRLGTAVMEIIIGNAAMLVMALFIIISTFGCNNGLILSGARVYYAMAKDKLFFEKTGKLNKYQVPGTGLWVQAIWAGVLCLSGTYSELLDYVVFAVLIFYTLTIAGIFILRIKQPDAERPYKALGYPVIPALYIFLALAIMVILLIYKPVYTWPGLIVVIIGIPVFYFWKSRNN